MRRLPWSVSTLSGWNWTPSIGMCAVAKSHDGAFAFDTGRNLQLVGDGVFADDQRVVAGAGHGLGDVAEDCASVVGDGAGFAMHQLFGPDDFAAEGRADGLMAEADAKGWNLLGQREAGEMADKRG